MSVDNTIAINTIFGSTGAETIPTGTTITSAAIDLRELSQTGSQSLHYIIVGSGTVILSTLQSNKGRDVGSASDFIAASVGSVVATGLTAGTGLVPINPVISRFEKFEASATGGSPTIELYWAGQ